MTTTDALRTAAPLSTPTPQPSAAPAPAWGQGDFQAALRQAEAWKPSGRSEEGAKSDKPEDDEDSEAAAAPEGRTDRREAGAPQKDDSAGDGRLESLVGGPPPPPQATLDPVVAPSAAGHVDLEFAAMLDRLALNAQGDKSKGLQLRFMDAGQPLSTLNVARGADGALNVQLSAHAHQAAQVNRSLEALKKRLTERGLDIADVNLRPDDGREVLDEEVRRL